ncbi:hypothetical protein J2R80_008352 [Bradyrhizobium sp. USDA 4541]|nr:hypothetical protein [Bradyrhizobium sp. USDA 4541]
MREGRPNYVIRTAPAAIADRSFGPIEIAVRGVA